MTPRSWTEIQSIVIDGKLTLTKLVRGGKQSAIFETVDPESDGAPTYFVQLYRAEDGAEARQILDRLEEARFLDHPGVLQPLGSGVLEAENLVFCVTSKPLYVLAEAPGTMPGEEARLLSANLIEVLTYLHFENLVYCNLRPEAVWKTENGWVLADFSQLRLMGRADSHELRRTVVRFGDTPPEVHQGEVSPAWDVWSLGLLLQRVFTGDSGRARQLRAGLPEPFQRIVPECLDPNPNERPTLQRIETLLTAPESVAEVRQPEAAPAWVPRHLRALDETGNHSWLGRFLRPSRLSWLIIFIVGILGVGIWTFALTHKHETTQVAAAAPVAPTPEVDRVNPRTSPAPVSDPAIRELLDRWVATNRAKDLTGQLALYAPVVDPFFKQRHVPRSRIASIKKRDFGSMGPVKKFDASDVQITQIDPTNAVVLFTKNWAFGKGAANHGSIRSQLTVQKFGQDWKIVAEREL
jgi:serine/threonine protein kinase